jgi:serine/threonine protein kinase
LALDRYCPLCDRDLSNATCPQHHVPTVMLSGAPAAPLVAEEMPGKVFAGRYVIERILGEGGMGVVFAAIQQSTRQKVAIKVMRTEAIGMKPGLMRFYREAHAVSLVDHPNVVRIVDFGVDDGTHQPFLVMNLATGETLKQVLERGPLSERRAARILAQVAGALVPMHANRIVHRDLKPENILIKKLSELSEHVTVLDFGFAQLHDENMARATATGSVIGSVAYMSPEQAMGSEVDFHADLYGLGAILHECVMGHPPFDPTNPIKALMDRISGNAPELPDRLGDGRAPSEGLIELRRSLLARQPEDRPSSAMMVHEVLALLGDGDSESALLILRTPPELPQVHRSTMPGPPGALDGGEEIEPVTLPPEPEPATDFRAQVARLPPVIDEHFDHKTWIQKLEKVDVIVFDFDAVGRLTSLGILEWTKLLKGLPATGYYCFVRCHANAVAQFNLLKDFPGRGEILSLFVPYVCPECESEIEVLVDVMAEKDRISRDALPPPECPRCGVPAEEEEQLYFQFVNACPPPAPHPIALRLVGDTSRGQNRGNP